MPLHARAAALRRPPRTSGYDYADQDPVNVFDLDGTDPRQAAPQCAIRHSCKSTSFGSLVRAVGHFVSQNRVYFEAGALGLALAFVAPELEPVLASALTRATIASRLPAAFAASASGTALANEATRIYNSLPGAMPLRVKIATTVSVLLKGNIAKAGKAIANVLGHVGR